jgi:hypothetical protein
VDYYDCGACGVRFSYRDSILNILIAGSEPVTDPDATPVAKAIMARYGIPETPDMLDRVLDLIRSSQEGGGTQGPVSAEIGHFIDRFQLSNIDYNCKLVRHYVEPVLPANTVLHRNVRVRNEGNFSWTSEGLKPVLLSYHWLNHEERTVEFEGQRTAFPIEIAPGREITIPLRIQTPKKPGPHILEVLLVHEHVRWASESSMRIPVTLTSQRPGPPACRIVPATKLPAFNEPEDSKIARSMIFEHLPKHSQDVCTLMEIGGGSSPECLEIMAQQTELNIRLINVDVSDSLLRLLSMHIEHNRRELFGRIALLCADATTLQLSAPVVHGVVICRALHHFPDPVGLLHTVRPWLAPNAFVAVVCEPVGTAFSEAGIFSLKAGVNEQVFTTEEYSGIFENAGFRVAECRVDWGFSLKAILRPAS